VEIAARREDEQRAADGRVALGFGEGDLLAGEEREDDEFDFASRPRTRLRSSRA
jgi:hypothetical protein